MTVACLRKERKKEEEEEAAESDTRLESSSPFFGLFLILRFPMVPVVVDQLGQLHGLEHVELCLNLAQLHKTLRKKEKEK